MKLESHAVAEIAGAMKVKKPRKLSDVQILVIRLIADMRGCYDNQRWGRESRLAKLLMEKYGRDFMFWLPKPEGYQVGSMMWFYDKLGQNYLSDQLFEYQKVQTSPTTERKEIPLESNKIGEDIIVEPVKPKTLKDFLNYGNQKN